MSLFPDNRPAPVDATAWVVWQYTDAEWAIFADGALARAKQAARKQLRADTQGAVAVTIMACFLMLAQTGTLVWWIGFLPVAWMLSGFQWYSLAMREAEAVYRRRTQGPVEIRIGARGLTEGGQYTSFVRAGRRPMTAEIVPDQPTWLHIVLRANQGHGLAQTHAWVLVPHGHESEALDFVTRFQTDVVGVYRAPFLFGVPSVLRLPSDSLDNPANPLPLLPPPATPTRALPRLWVGGTPESQRYGASAPSLPPVVPPDHPTELLPPAP